MKNTICEIQEWYLGSCNGEWEHHFGITIGTLDNPGWSVYIDLKGTPLEERRFVSVTRGVNEELHPIAENWLVCRKHGTRFEGASGPLNLNELLETFLKWKDENRT